MGWEFKRQRDTNIFHVYDSKAPLLPIGVFVFMYSAEGADFVLPTEREARDRETASYSAGFEEGRT